MFLRTTQNLLLLFLFNNGNEIRHFLLRKRPHQWNCVARKIIGLIKIVVNTRSGKGSFENVIYVGLFEMMVRVLTTCHTQYTWHRSTGIFFSSSVRLRQGSGLCSSSFRKFPGTEGTNQNRHWNHHRWHATNSLERTRLSCWCL